MPSLNTFRKGWINGNYSQKRHLSRKATPGVFRSWFRTSRWGFLIIHNSPFLYVVYTCRGIILWIWWIKDFENVYISFVIVYGFVVHNCTLILRLLCICDWCGFGAAATVAARIVYNVCRKCTFTIYGNSAHYSLPQWSII